MLFSKDERNYNEKAREKRQFTIFPESAEPLGDAYSFHKLITFLECPFRYKLKYIEGVGDDIKNRYKLTLGLNIHTTLQEFFDRRNKDRTLENLIRILHRRWSSVGFSDKSREDKWKNLCESLLRNFYVPEIVNVVPFSLETSFKINISGITIKGKIDRIDKIIDNGYEVIDYKVFPNINPYEKSHNSLQALLYFLAAECLFSRNPIRITFWYLYGEKNYRVDKTPAPQEVKEGINAIKKIVREIETTKEFKPTPSERICSDCNYKGKYCQIKNG